jgi:hypothetical protein
MNQETTIDDNLTKQLLTNEKALKGFIMDLQEFLKKKLEPCENDDGNVEYWTCGIYHYDPPSLYEPFRNFITFCTKKHLDWVLVRERIEQYAGKMIHCECFIVNRVTL